MLQMGQLRSKLKGPMEFRTRSTDTLKSNFSGIQISGVKKRRWEEVQMSECTPLFKKPNLMRWSGEI